MAGSKQVSIVVQNMTDNAKFIKKGVRVAHIVSAMLAPSAEAPSEQEEDAQAPKEHMMVQERQQKLMEKLNLKGLSKWTPRNAATARSFCSPIMMPLRSSLMSSDVPAPLNTRSASVMMNHSKSALDVYLHLY